MTRGLGCQLVASVLVGLLAAPRALAASAGASAAPARPTLAVVSFALDDASLSAAARVGLQAERAARTVGRHEVLDPVALLDPAGTRARADKATEGKAAFEAARKLYDDLDLAKAAEGCDKALGAFERSDLSTSFDQLIGAWTLRIGALLANTENKKAQIELGLLLPMGAKATFDPNIFAPDFIAQVKQKREELAKKSDLSFSVEAKPAAARVFVDGSFRGYTPLEVKGLSPGDHFLTLIAPGYQLIQKRFRGGPTAPENAPLEPTPKFAASQPSLAALRQDLRQPKGRAFAGQALAKELGVDQVLALGVGAQGRQLLATRIGADGVELAFLEEALLEGAAADTLQAAIARVVSTDSKTRIDGGSFHWSLRHTGYVLLGLGVAAGGVGGVFGWQAKSASDSFKDLQDKPQINPIWTDRASSGKTYALAADLSFLGAIVLAAAGVTLAVVGGPKKDAGDDEPKPVIHLPPPEEKKPDDKKPDDKKPDDKKPEEKKKPDEKKPDDAVQHAPENDKKTRAEEEKRAKLEEKKKADEERRAKVDEKRKAEEERKAKAADEKKAKADEKQRAADEKKKAEDDRRAKAVEDKRAAEARARGEEEQKAKAEEERLAADAKARSADDKQARAAEEKRATEEKAKADEAKKAEDARRAAEEQKKAEEAKKKLPEEHKKPPEKKIEDGDDLQDR